MVEKPLYRYSLIDSGSLCKLFRAEDVYIPSADDYTKPADIMRFIDNALRTDVMYVLGRDPRHEAFIFAPSHNSTTFQGHFAIRKDKRGGDTIKKTVEAGKWIFDHTTCRSIIAFINEHNMPARATMAQVGMKKVGIIRGSVLFNGEYQDEYVYQMTVGDYNALWGQEFGEVK